MSYQIDTKHAGVLVFRLIKPLTKLEVASLVREIEKSLKDGKSKFVLDFSKEAATAAIGFGFIQKECSKLQVFAKKMRGDILYVLPEKLAARVEGSYPDIAVALQIAAAGSVSDDKQRLVDELKEKVAEQSGELAKLKAAIEILAKKNKELLELVGQPSTDAEMKAAINHYRNLASEVQAVSPNLRNK